MGVHTPLRRDSVQDAMLAKCTNPACSATFRYLHEGRLFAIETNPVATVIRSWAEPDYMGESNTREYFWLCSSCCRVVRIQLDGDHKVTVINKEEASNASVEENITPVGA
jgi:hypothetical protein